jgi:hypothetical protein
MTPDDVDEDRAHLLPIVGEAPQALWEMARGGQPLILTRDGAPALVVLDVDSFAEWAEASGTTP